MNKKLFAVLIALMTLSLLGIIFVQGYWINNSYQTKEDQFTFNVRQTLLVASDKIQLRELEDYYNVYSGYVDTIDVPDNVSFSELIYTSRNEGANETFIFSDRIFREDYKLTSNFLDTEFDTIQFRKITNKKSKTKIVTGIDGIGTSSETKIESFSRLKNYERNQFEEAFRNISAKTPIHKRVQGSEIQQEISKELAERGVTSSFEYAVYSNDLSTKVKSDDFQLDPENTYETPLFVNEEFDTNYVLYVNFPGKKKEVLSSIMGMAMLSFVFTGVIILAYASALSQLLRQRQISQIKTDFINNMTHEFKTPIATINLALDALNNPKVKDDKDFLARYLGLIREENKRMHAQVENVLRISKLERNELDLPKDKIDLHHLLKTAISHVGLIVEDRGGYIETHFDATESIILGSESHLTNVIVNILDNAIKYSEDSPKIDVFTENAKGGIIFRVRDQGMGMTKAVQKRIFEKFYRESMGDLHNVKGHGLGLAYVKKILEDHDAEIQVESEKDKGSTFSIKLQLTS